MPKTLLLADDSVVIQKLVGLSFANEDVELITTDNGDDALSRAREVQPDLILADVVMPGKNGYEVCQAIKSDPGLRHIPVLLLTGTFEAFDEGRSRQVGADGHITKPFEAQGLVDRVTDLLSRPRPRPPAVAAAPTPAPAPTAQAPARGAAAPPAAPVPAPPTASADDAYDFFDDDASDLAAPEPVAARPIAAPPLDLASPDDAFEFGSDLDGLDTTDSTSIESDTLDTNFELDDDGPQDLTVAVVPPATAPAARPPVPPPIPNDRNAPDATQVALGETMIQEDFATPPRAEVASLDARLPQPPRPRPAPAPTVLADDLFADATPPPVPEVSETTEPTMPPAMDSGFEFGFEEARTPAPGPAPTRTAPAAVATPVHPGRSLAGLDATDPLADIAPEMHDFSAGEALAPSLDDAAESTHGGYDVSSSDLGDPLSSGPDHFAAPRPPQRPASDIGLSAPQLAAAPRSGGPDISAVMRDRIHETLEKIAWEAFADVSDSIVRQVLERVESVVWEVVPQMAEALIQEEIRRMKGDD